MLKDGRCNSAVIVICNLSPKGLQPNTPARSMVKVVQVSATTHPEWLVITPLLDYSLHTQHLSVGNILGKCKRREVLGIKVMWERKGKGVPAPPKACVCTEVALSQS